MSQVPSDVSISNQYLDTSKYKTQSHLNSLEVWTKEKQMKLNVEKTDYMIINFTEDYQFNTRLKLEDKVLQQVHSKKLLGLVISDDLSWKANTSYLVKRAYSRMSILRNLFSFGVDVQDLVEIYTLYIRSVVEQSAVVWHSSLTEEEQTDLERVQKVALKIILKEKYQDYNHALRMTGLEKLTMRRQKLCLNFARKCTKNQLTMNMFPVRQRRVNTRHPEKYQVPFARTDRFKNSAIPYMARLLNSNPL